MSLNKFYAGMHWTKRREEAQRVHTLVHAQLQKNSISLNNSFQLFTKKVTVTITAYFAERPLDPDNIVSKLYIDALKKYVVLDDSAKYIDAVTNRSEIDRKNPRVEIDIIEVTASMTV